MIMSHKTSSKNRWGYIVLALLIISLILFFVFFKLELSKSRRVLFFKEKQGAITLLKDCANKNEGNVSRIGYIFELTNSNNIYGYVTAKVTISQTFLGLDVVYDSEIDGEKSSGGINLSLTDSKVYCSYSDGHNCIIENTEFTKALENIIDDFTNPPIIGAVSRVVEDTSDIADGKIHYYYELRQYSDILSYLLAYPSNGKHTDGTLYLTCYNDNQYNFSSSCQRMYTVESLETLFSLFGKPCPLSNLKVDSFGLNIHTFLE